MTQQIDLKFPNDSTIHEVPKVKDQSICILQHSPIITDMKPLMSY